MAAPGWKIDFGIRDRVLEVLRSEPFTVSFFQAVRLLACLEPNREPVGYFGEPKDEIVHFVANPSLAFPASEIQSLENWPKSASEWVAPLKMTVNFMGLCSPVGVLPNHYTELVIQRSEQYDNEFRDFLDIFNHRFISLMYRAWAKHRFYIGYEQNHRIFQKQQTEAGRFAAQPSSSDARVSNGKDYAYDSLTPLLLSIVGLNTAGLAGRQDIADQTLVYYAGILGQHPRSAQGLQQILRDYLRVNVAVEQFVGRWIPLPATNRTQLLELQSMNDQLGLGAVVGDEVWDQQSTVRIKLGPLTRSQYCGFLPIGEAKAYKALKSLLRFYSNDEFDFEVQLILKKEDVPSLELREDTNQELLLGWMTWMKTPATTLDRDPGETILQMSA